MPQLPLFQRTSGIEEIPFGKRVAIYRVGMEKAVILNEVGSVLWERFRAPQDRATLVAHLAGRFPTVDQARLERDVEEYLEQLQRMGIIALVEGAPAS